MDDLKSKSHSREAESRSKPNAFSRRSLLKGSVKAMPVVLTLHSGAALARSSNLISGTDALDSDGNFRCLDTQTLTPVDGVPDLYDFGEPPVVADVAVIPDRDYYTAPADTLKPAEKSSAITPNSGWKQFDRRQAAGANKVADAERVSVTEMCRKGGEYHYEEAGGWNCIRIEKGMLVSSTAMNSFAGNLNFPSINNCEL